MPFLERDHNGRLRQAQFKDGNWAIDNLGNRKKWYISILNLSGDTGKVMFHGFLKNFNDNFNSNWNKEEVFGRMDPIGIFKNTSREISLSWEVPAVSEGQARSNVESINKLIQFMYPKYQDYVGDENFKNKKTNKSNKSNKSNVRKMTSNRNKEVSSIMQSSPLLKFKFTNLISSARTSTTSVETSGLIGFIDGGLSIEPDLEVGVFGSKPGEIYPKLWTISCNIVVLHDHLLGWTRYNGVDAKKENPLTFSVNSKTSRLVDQGFPYGVGPDIDNAPLPTNSAIPIPKKKRSNSDNTIYRNLTVEQDKEEKIRKGKYKPYNPK